LVLSNIGAVFEFPILLSLLTISFVWCFYFEFKGNSCNVQKNLLHWFLVSACFIHWFLVSACFIHWFSSSNALWELSSEVINDIDLINMLAKRYRSPRAGLSLGCQIIIIFGRSPFERCHILGCYLRFSFLPHKI
jgi:hypothetical protein